MGPAEEKFQKLVAQLDYPMFIATVATGEERAGCLIGFATQCSIHPPRFLAGISDKNHTHRVAQRAVAMGIHLVPEEATELAELFGGETGDEVDKFERCSWRPGPEGVPLLDDCPNRFAAASSSEWSSATTRAWCSTRSSPRSRSRTTDSSASTGRSASSPGTKPESIEDRLAVLESAHAGGPRSHVA